MPQGRQKGYIKQLLECVNELIGNDLEVTKSIGGLEDQNKMRLVWKEQLRNFIRQCPDNIYLKPAERRLQEDYLHDQRVFSVRDRQSKDISKLFFDRFTSN